MTKTTDPVFKSDKIKVFKGDCIEVMKSMPENSIDAIVTDPPYGLGFMGKKWDDLPPGKEWAEECLRVLKPGGHILAFGGSRTWHRLAVAIEDAGFEIRDSVAWLYGSGFPKSMDISKAIDKSKGVEFASKPASGVGFMGPEGTGESTDEAKKWDGWGTALKPAFEPIVMGRKPISEKTVVANVLKHNTGAINIDDNRIATDEKIANHLGTNGASGLTYGNRKEYIPGSSGKQNTHNKGRFPSNVILDETSSSELNNQYKDVSRFFRTFKYHAKANKSERPIINGIAHPTVKPIALINWLVKLITPVDGTVLDTFAGSGTIISAAENESFKVVAIEKEEDYIPLILSRIK